MKDPLDRENGYYEDLGVSPDSPSTGLQKVLADRMKGISPGEMQKIQIAMRKIADPTERLMIDAARYPAGPRDFGVGDTDGFLSLFDRLMGTAPPPDAAVEELILLPEASGADVPLESRITVLPRYASFESWPCEGDSVAEEAQ